MLEAMAAGLPVLCADKGGQLDFAVDGYNAVLFESDNAALLADRIASVLERPAVLEQLAVNARQTARERDWDSIFDTLLADYGRVQEARRPAETLA